MAGGLKKDDTFDDGKGAVYTGASALIHARVDELLAAQVKGAGASADSHSVAYGPSSGAPAAFHRAYMAAEEWGANAKGGDVGRPESGAS